MGWKVELRGGTVREAEAINLCYWSDMRDKRKEGLRVSGRFSVWVDSGVIQVDRSS